MECDSAEDKALCEMLGHRIEDTYNCLKNYVDCLLGFLPSNRVLEFFPFCLNLFLEIFCQFFDFCQFLISKNELVFFLMLLAWRPNRKSCHSNRSARLWPSFWTPSSAIKFGFYCWQQSSFIFNSKSKKHCLVLSNRKED